LNHVETMDAADKMVNNTDLWM